MTTVPPAHQVLADAQAVQDLAAKVAETYRALHDSGFYRDHAGERAGGRGGHVDTTGAAATGREVARRKLEAAAGTVEATKTLLGAALVKLHQLGEWVDDDARHSADDLDALIPRDVLKVEVAEARARQARRDAEESLQTLRRARADAGRERARVRGKSKPKGGGGRAA